MNGRALLLLLLVTGCNTRNTLSPEDTKLTRTEQHDLEIQELILRDADNKRWARKYLHEIDAAVRNDDWDSVKFYMTEYRKIPMDIVPHYLRDEPGYVQPVSALEKFFRITIFLPAE